MKADRRALAAEETAESGSEEQLWCGSPSTGVGEGEAGELLEVEIPKSCHGGALLAVAQVCDQSYRDEMGTHQAFGRFANGMLLFLLGCGIQFAMIGLLYFFSEERMQDPYEEVGTQTLAEDLWTALGSGKALEGTDQAVELCMQDHSVPWSQSMVIFVWLCKCVPAIVNAAWVTWVLAALPSREGTTVTNKTGKLSIVGLPMIVKLMAVVFIQLPLVFLDVCLAIVGMKFLMYCNALGKLLVKAMSLSYIETVAGVTFAGLSSKAFQAEVNKASLVHRFKKMPPAYKLESWLSGLLKIVSIFSFTIWYCRIKHSNLQDFRYACFRYKYQFVFPNCGHCGLDFFGMHLAN